MVRLYYVAFFIAYRTGSKSHSFLLRLRGGPQDTDCPTTKAKPVGVVSCGPCFVIDLLHAWADTYRAQELADGKLVECVPHRCRNPKGTQPSVFSVAADEEAIQKNCTASYIPGAYTHQLCLTDLIPVHSSLPRQRSLDPFDTDRHKKPSRLLVIVWCARKYSPALCD